MTFSKEHFDNWKDYYTYRYADDERATTELQALAGLADSALIKTCIAQGDDSWDGVEITDPDVKQAVLSDIMTLNTTDSYRLLCDCQGEAYWQPMTVGYFLSDAPYTYYDLEINDARYSYAVHLKFEDMQTYAQDILLATSHDSNRSHFSAFDALFPDIAVYRPQNVAEFIQWFTTGLVPLDALHMRVHQIETALSDRPHILADLKNRTIVTPDYGQKG